MLMRRLLICFAGVLLLAGLSYGADAFKVVTLAVPRAAVAHEAIWLKLTVASLPRGSLLRVSTDEDRPIGTVSPFGATARTPQEYTLPLGKDVVAGGTVRLRIQMQEPNGTLRAPTPSELLSSTLIYLPAGN